MIVLVCSESQTIQPPLKTFLSYQKTILRQIFPSLGKRSSTEINGYTPSWKT